jgi:hypothetical protein
MATAAIAPLVLAIFLLTLNPETKFKTSAYTYTGLQEFMTSLNSGTKSLTVASSLSSGYIQGTLFC